MIVLKAELTDNLRPGDKAGVLKALQQAIELEHSTIPPYLYALYSIVPGKNEIIADIIQSIVVEEMLHLTLAANVLNALGGAPVLDTANFVPTYPGPLPGAVESGLIVPLAPLSIEAVTGTFMVIEEPEHPLEFPVGALEAFAETQEPVTIGQFYRAIEAQIESLGDGAFVPGPRHQIGPDLMDDAVVVTDVATAGQAITTIVDQGEGTQTTPEAIVGGGYAHYYRFQEISEGGLLVPNPKAGPTTPPKHRFVFDPVHHPVPFDPAGVFPVPTNPSYPPGSVGQIADTNFNYTYTSLLKVLHTTLNGHPELLKTAIGMMMSLRQQAMDMTSGTDTGGQNIGPSFRYQPVDS